MSDSEEDHVENLIKLTSRAKEVHDKMKSKLDPGEQLNMLDRLLCKALVQDALVEYSWIPPDMKENRHHIIKPQLDTIKELETEIALRFDGKAKKFVAAPSGADGGTPDDSSDDDTNVPDDEHENGACRRYVTAYKRARHFYFQTVFALEPGQDLTPDAAVECLRKFKPLQQLYNKIPEGVKSELRTKNTVGKIYDEVGHFIEHLQSFVDEFMTNEIDAPE